MALSDEERRRLEMLERELAQSDPELARRMQSKAAHSHGGDAARIVRGVLTMAAALALVITGIASGLIIIGAGGFALMIAGATILLNGLHPDRGAQEPS